MRAGKEPKVPGLRDYLDRFRPAGAPGAGGTGVPADRPRELETELTTVLALLDGVHAECTGIVAKARRDAERMVAAARGEAAAVADDADRRARAARERAAGRCWPRRGPKPSALLLMPKSKPCEYANAPGSASRRWRAEPSALSGG